MSDIERRLLAIMTEELNLDVPSPTADLVEIGVLDSMAFVDLLFNIEQHFGVRIDLDALELENFNTVERIAAFVRSQGRAAAEG